MIQTIKFNVSTVQYALKNNLHVEYFIQCYLKSLNDTGIYHLNDIRVNYDDKKTFLMSLRKHFKSIFKQKIEFYSELSEEQKNNFINEQTSEIIKNNCFKKFSFESHLKDNIFFVIKDEKIFIRSNKRNKTQKKSYNFKCNFKEATFMAQKEATHSKKLIYGWNETLIRYFFISIWASQFNSKKPYALDLISQDLGISVSTIQKALKVFEVNKTHRVQEKNTLRSYQADGRRINLSPNYMNMPFGSFSSKENSRI